MQKLQWSGTINYLKKGIAFIIVAGLLFSVTSCGKKTYGQSKRKFKSWGMLPQHKEVI